MSDPAIAPEMLGEFPRTGNVATRQARAGAARWLLLAAVGFALLALFTLLIYIVGRGWSFLSWSPLITDPPSRKPERAGMNPAIWGSLWVISLTILIAFPVGIGAAIYLEEYATKGRWSRILAVNIQNLAGVPSVVYGLLGLGIFVEMMHLGRVVLAGALTMAVLSLPVIIIAGREALRAVPPSLREAAYGVGATQWQVIWSHVLPAALPGILTGTILAVSRAIGETAPLLVVGAAGYIATRPAGFLDSYTAMPIQIYSWTARPQPAFRDLASAAIIVLMAILLVLNSAAIFLRQYYSKKTRW